MRRRITWCMAMATAVLAGCAKLSSVPMLPISNEGHYLPGQPATGLVADPQSPIRDVPKPMGFVAVSPDAVTAQPMGVRQLRQAYQGRASIPEVWEFYQRQLKLHRWRPLETQITEKHLTYTNGAEKLDIQLRKEWMVVTITITIGPFMAPAP